MQRLAKFKKKINQYMQFRATLIFRKFKVALNIFKLCQKLHLIQLIKILK